MNSTEVRELVGILEAEVNNGGFDQFFFNSAGDRTAEIISALEAIGAVHTAAIVRSAASKFPGETPPVDRDARQALLLEQVSPDGDAFEGDDQAFFAYHDDLELLVNAYAS